MPEGAPAGFDRARAEIGFVATDVPGYGYAIYRLRSPNGAAPHRRRATAAFIENEYLHVRRIRLTAR